MVNSNVGRVKLLKMKVYESENVNIFFYGDIGDDMKEAIKKVFLQLTH